MGEPLPQAIYREKYYSLFRDDYTGACWVYLMKTKRKVHAKFQIFCACKENQSACKLKVLQADGGGKYFSTQFQEKLKKTSLEW